MLAIRRRGRHDLRVAHGFSEPDRDQQFLLPPSLREWLPPDHQVWFLIELVEGLDLSELEESYRLGAQGRAPLSPAMLLTLLVYAYSRGVESSRAIERACREDVAFRVICANQGPDHTTVARFRQRHEPAFRAVFAQVLGLCGRAGMVRLGVVALDGTKMAGDASLDANRTTDAIRAEVDRIVERAAAIDAEEDERLGERGGDELPADLADPARRRARLAELVAEAEAEGRARVNLTDPESRVMASTKGFVQGFNAQALTGAGGVILAAEVTNAESDTHQLVAMLDALGQMLAEAGIDDELGTILADAGYFSAANVAALAERDLDALIATTKRRNQPSRVPAGDAGAAHRAEQAALDGEQAAERARQGAIFERVARGAAMRDVLEELGLSQAVAYAHYGQWRRGGAEAISVPRRRRRVPAPTPAAQARRAMEAKLADPAHRATYARRSHLVETTFAQLKHNRRATRFRRRGLTAVNSEWKLHGIVHNAGRLRVGLDNLFAAMSGTATATAA